MNILASLYETGSPSRLDLIVAHETGHALVGWLSPFVDEIRLVSVSDQRNSFTDCLRVDWGDANPPESYWDFACFRLAGLAAEISVHEIVSPQGSIRDFCEARDALVRVLDEYGVASCPWHDPVASVRFDIGEFYRGRLDPEVRRAMNSSYAHARFLIATHTREFSLLYEALRRRFHLLPEDIVMLLGRERPWFKF